MRQGRVELPLVDHGEPVDAWMNEEALESRRARGRQTFNVLLVVAHYTAPRHPVHPALAGRGFAFCFERSEEHTSELQSRLHLVCRLLLEKKKLNTAAVA